MRWSTFYVLAFWLPLAVAPQAKAEETLVTQAEIPVVAAFVADGFDSVWAVNGPRVARVNPSDNRFIEIAPKDYSGETKAIAVGEGAVWVPDVLKGAIQKIDPQSNTAVPLITVKMTGHDGSVGVGFGSVWVIAAEAFDRTLERFNASTGAMEAKTLLPGHALSVLVDFGAVWVTSDLEDELYRIDPDSYRILSTTQLGRRPERIGSAAGSIWILNQGDSTIQRVDGRTAEVVSTIVSPMKAPFDDLSFGGGYLWYSNRAGEVARIDPRTNEVTGTFRVPLGNGALRYAAGSLWMGGPFLTRIGLPLH